MKGFKRCIIIVMLLNGVFILNGCWDQKIYEKIGFMLQVGLELDEEGKILYTVGVPVVSTEAKERFEVLTTSANLMREGRDKVRLVSGKTVEGGKIQQIFVSEDIARKGVSAFMEIFLRNPENPLLANVIVVEGSPNEMMKYSKDFKDKQRPTFYVNELLESARKTSVVPETRVSHFTILTHSGTIDPAAPLIRYNRNEIQVAGTALFSGDKIAGKINVKETGLLLALMGQKKDMDYIYRGPYSEKSEEILKNGISVMMKGKKRKIKVDIKENKPIIDIKLDFKGYIGEYSGELDLANAEDKKKLEEAIAHGIENDCTKLLKYLVEAESDPIGFGEIVRVKHNSYWKSIKWKDEYENAVFRVSAKVGIDFYGAVTNP